MTGWAEPALMRVSTFMWASPAIDWASREGRPNSRTQNLTTGERAPGLAATFDNFSESPDKRRRVRVREWSCRIKAAGLLQNPAGFGAMRCGVFWVSQGFWRSRWARSGARPSGG